MSINAFTELMKARFIGVHDDSGLLDRQMPLDRIGEESELVLQFGDTDMFTTFLEITDGTTKYVKEFQLFEEKIKILSDEELNNCLKCVSDDMINLLSTTVSCVGCRRAVETLFQLVSEMDYRTLYPIRLLTCSEHETSCEFTIEDEYLVSMKKLFMLLYVFKPQLEFVVNIIPKSRKNKRCNLHCLDSHKVKSVGIWMDFWKALNTECRDEIVTINIDVFVEALDSYLQKHRFCQECKAKVERALKLLLKDVKPDEKDEEYDDDIFSGIKICKDDKHLHIDTRDDTISNLISRAEPELTNSRRERHAKTMDVAQEEVLTCLGIVLHEKLHKLCQKVKAEEQTWMILINICLECMKRQLVLAVEEKRGYTNMELFLLEHEEETKKKELRKEMKREKKRKKKLARKVNDGNNDPNSTSKEDYTFNEENDDDEDDGEDEEEEVGKTGDEKKVLKEVHPMAEQKQRSEDGVEPHDDVASDWQVVEKNHCKQCNMRKVTRTQKSCNGKTECTGSPDFDRHFNNIAQGGKWASGSILNSKRKSKSSSDVTASLPTCCRGAAGRCPQKAAGRCPQKVAGRCTEKISPPTSSANHVRSLQKQSVPQAPTLTTINNNGKRHHCNRSSPSNSAAKSTSSSSLPSTANTAASQPSENSSSFHSCSQQDQVESEHKRRHLYSPQSRPAQKRPDSTCSCQGGGHTSPPFSSQSTLVNQGGSELRRSKMPTSSPMRVYMNHGVNLTLSTELIENSLTSDYLSLSTSDEPESGVHFIPEQERQYFHNNWAEIREQRDLLRSKLRQAWTEKTKATS